MIIVPMPNETLEIKILSEIGWGFDLRSLTNKLRGFKGTDIRVPINSYGGSVPEGTAIYTTLQGRNETITTCVIGYAISMASAIFMAGEKRQMAKGSYLMIHNPWNFAAGDHEDMDTVAKTLKTMTEGLITIYQDATNLGRDVIAKMMDDETWINAEDALKMGFATEITEGAHFKASIPKSDFKKFEYLNNYKNIPQNLLAMSDNNKGSKWDQFVNKVFGGKEPKSMQEVKAVLDKKPEGQTNPDQVAQNTKDIAEIAAMVKTGFEQIGTEIKAIGKNVENIPGKDAQNAVKSELDLLKELMANGVGGSAQGGAGGNNNFDANGNGGNQKDDEIISGGNSKVENNQDGYSAWFNEWEKSSVQN